MVAYAVFAITVALAAANRTTGAFLVLAYWLIILPRPTRTQMGWGAVYALVWLLSTLAVRQWTGTIPNPFTPQTVWAYNRGTLAATLVSFIAFFGVWWWLLVRALPDATGYLRRLLILSALYLVAFLILGVWHETRLLLWVLPIWVAVALRHLLQDDMP